MDLGDHAPHGLAQQRGRGHGGGAAAQLIVDRPAEIELKRCFGLLAGKLAVGGKAAEIEQRRVEPGIFPVHQPQPLAVIDEIGGEQIVVAEHDVDRADGSFEPRRPRQKVGEHGKVPAVAFAQRVRIVAHDMEHPEHRAGPAQILRNVPVAPPHHVDQAIEIRRIADVLRREGASLDEIEHENARLRMHHAGAKPARCAARLAANSFARTTPCTRMSSPTRTT